MVKAEGAIDPGEADRPVRLSEDDRAARRIANLYLRFTNASAPIPSKELISNFYPDETPDSARRKFRRDKQVLVSCGLVIENVGRPGAGGLWQVDPHRSYARTDLLSPQEARVIDILCLPFVSDTAFSGRNDLRSALFKIDRTFSGESALSVQSRGRHDAHDGSISSKVLAVLNRCYALRHRVRADYVDAAGKTSTKTLEIYGTFGMRSHSYFVCAETADQKDDPAPVPHTFSPRTYRDDRFLRAKELSRDPSYEIPEDFSVDEYRRLPFQMGSPTCEVTFFVPKEALDSIAPLARRQGRLDADRQHHAGRNGCLWHVPASDAACAGAWAIGLGIEPLDPPEARASWKKTLEEAIGHGE